MLQVAYQSECKTVFLHVPKTGGATFRDIMSSIYGQAFHFCMDPTVAGVRGIGTRKGIFRRG